MFIPKSAREHLKSQSLSVWDTASLLVGIVVGVSIFKVPPLVFSNSVNPLSGLGVWLLGAVLSLCGALCFSELATTYPGFGGEYQYISKAYSKRLGFLFAWMQICVILTASIGAMAFVFADYAAAFYSDLETLLAWNQSGTSVAENEPLQSRINPTALAASLAILFSSTVHAFGIKSGKAAQNILTISKVAALIAILLVGVFVTKTEAVDVLPAEGNPRSGNLGLALVFVMYAYGGWNDIAMVTPEVRNHQRNMPRALLFGLGFVGLLYLALNFVFLKVLGFEGVRNSSIPASDVIGVALGAKASILMNLIVMCSALGAIHGTTFASCRLLSALGDDFFLFRKCRNWSQRGVPLFALIAITAITLLLIVAVGTQLGRVWTSELAEKLYLPRPDWARYFGGFDTLVAATAPIFWLFFALSGFAVIVLRIRDRSTKRSFKIPLFPIPVIIFCGSAIFMFWKSVDYAGKMTFLCLPVVLLGILLSFTPQRRASQPG